MEIFNALNLSQITGGTKLKQGDFGSVLSYSLADENGQEITSFDTKTAYINLVLDDKILFTTTTQVDISRVTFHIDKAVPTGLYYLEIKIDDYIFPSDKDSVILIEEGATAYDLKDLVPNYDVAMTITDILSDLSQKGVDITDLKTKMNAIYNNALADNMEVAKARGTYKTLGDRLENFNTEVGNIVSGSPKGTFSSLAALQSAKPSGDTGIYITTDNGHWWFWSGIWKDGGVYQSTGIAPNSVAIGMLTTDIKGSIGVWADENPATPVANGVATISNGVLTGYGTQNYWWHEEYDAANGDQFRVSFSNSDNASVASHVFALDSNNKIIQSWYPGQSPITDNVDYEIFIPYSATKLVVQSFQKNILNVKRLSVPNFNLTIPSSFDIYFSSGSYPTVTFANGNLVVNLPAGTSESQRMFAFDRMGNSKGTLWTGAFSANDAKQTYASSYNLASSYGLFWNFETNTLMVDNINNTRTYPNVLLALNGNGYMSAGYFKKYETNVLTDTLSSNISNLSEVSVNSNHTFISRQGQLGGYPENSIEGVIYAKNKGYDNVRVSLRFTSDDVPVLIHDASINRTARNSDGSVINTTINISDITLKQANTYDWGIFYGAKFAGIKLATLDEFMRVSAYKGIKPNLEVKVDTMTANQVTTISNLILKYGLSNVTTITNTASGIETLRSLYALNNSLSVGLITYPTTTAVVDTVLEFKNYHNNVRLDIFDTNTIPPEVLIYASTKNVGIKVGSANSINDIIKWVELGVNQIEVAYVSYPKTALSAYYDKNF